MNYDLNNPLEYLEFTKAVEECIRLKKKVTLSPVRKSRTHSQNNYLHFLCSYFATEYGCSKAEAKEVYLKRQACPDIFREVYTNKHGRQIIRYRSTASLSSAENSSAITNFIAWAAVGGIELPLPTDTGFRRHAERQIENMSHLI